MAHGNLYSTPQAALVASSGTFATSLRVLDLSLLKISKPHLTEEISPGKCVAILKPGYQGH